MGELVTHPLDFNDGYPRCDECGAVVPAEDSRPLLRVTYKANVNYEGQSEYGRHEMVVCLWCRRRLLRRRCFREWRAKIGMALAVGFVIGALTLIILGILFGFGVVR